MEILDFKNYLMTMVSQDITKSQHVDCRAIQKLIIKCKFNNKNILQTTITFWMIGKEFDLIFLIIIFLLYSFNSIINISIIILLSNFICRMSNKSGNWSCNQRKKPCCKEIWRFSWIKKNLKSCIKQPKISVCKILVLFMLNYVYYLFYIKNLK